MPDELCRQVTSRVLAQERFYLPTNEKQRNSPGERLWVGRSPSDGAPGHILAHTRDWRWRVAPLSAPAPEVRREREYVSPRRTAHSGPQDRAWSVPTLREPRYSQSLERGLAILGCFPGSVRCWGLRVLRMSWG